MKLPIPSRMKLRFPIGVLFACLVLSTIAGAQDPCPNNNVSCSAVPRLIRFTGALVDSSGHPRSGVVGITFSVYSQATGGSPLWQETQNVPLDTQGRYAVLLGITKVEGLPVEVFSSPEPRWLGVWPQWEGEQEHSRVILVSVPYALKAADTETLQGLPASAFLRATSSPTKPGGTVAASPGPVANVVIAAASSASSNSAKTSDSPVTTPGGTVNTMPKFGSLTSIINSQISDSNGVVGMQNLANILFADQYPNGVSDAITACPTSGCVIYAYSPNVNLNLGTIDPGSKSVTLYLGPYTYNVTQITLEPSFKIIGMGARATTLQSTNGNNPVIVIRQAVGGAAQHVLLSGFQLLGSAGNSSEDAIFLDSSTYLNSGMWYSELRDISIYGFAGNGIHIKGTNADYSGLTQLSEFDRVVVVRTPGGGNALRIEGGAYNLDFNDCQFDGAAAGDGTNIFIGARPGNPFAIPIDMNFRGLTSQAAAVAVQVDGGWAISFDLSHHEKLWGGYLVTSDLGAGTAGLSISGAGFQTSGTNNGAGYLLNVATSFATGVRFIHNHIMNPADVVVLVQSGANVTYQDNEFFGGTILPQTQGITMQLASAATINIAGAHTVALTTSNTPISTIQAMLGAGEEATFYGLDGPVTFASGGNINLMGASSITVNGSITFILSDVGKTPSWVPISQWAPPSSSMTPGFRLSSFPLSLTLAPGGNGSVDLTLTPQNGFNGTVDLTCAGASSAISCSVQPNNLLLNSANPGNATILVASTVKASSSGGIGPFGSFYLALLPLGCMGSLMLLLLRSKGCRQLEWPALSAGLLLVAFGSVGCGTSAASQGKPSYYSPVVTASSGTYSQTLIFSVTVE
jgi:hypothetical protein